MTEETQPQKTTIQPPQPQKQIVAEAKDVERGIIRILGKDILGGVKVSTALTRVRGVGKNLAVPLTRAIEKEFGIKPDAKVGNLSDQQITDIEETIKNPAGHGVFSFMLNRNLDDDTGAARHVVQSDLQFATRQDIEKQKALRSWRGWRHSLGQKTRGQHNRTTGRTGMTVGVLKKAMKAQKEASKTAPAASEKAAAAAPAAKK